MPQKIKEKLKRRESLSVSEDTGVEQSKNPIKTKSRSRILASFKKGVSLKSAVVEMKLNKKVDRNNNFVIQRFKNNHGFYIYSLENKAEGRKIFIQRHLFSRFRACIRAIMDDESQHRTKAFEYNVSFLNKDYFYFKSSNVDLDNLIIQDVEERKGSSGYITVSRRSLSALGKLLYNEKLQHPNDAFEEIISYHKLFQFSFVKGSKSITSDLSLRKDVLYSVERYKPNLTERLLSDKFDLDSAENKPAIARTVEPAKGDNVELNPYQTKLGQRYSEKNITVDYAELFEDKKILLPSTTSQVESKKGAQSVKSKACFEFNIPLSASNIKLFADGKFFFELSTSESGIFREGFIGDRSSEFYLGFEIVDALFTFNKSIKSFRFPLYYTKIKIRESGRGVHIECQDNGRFYLNHLALAHLVERFTDNTRGADPVNEFFNTLLVQDISIDRINDRIHLVRHLPLKEAIFDRTREILFGYQDENGKGGILSELKLKGIECDLESTILYRANQVQNPIEQAFEADLEKINTIAHQATGRFYHSLLGQFLTPELSQRSASDLYSRSQLEDKTEFARLTWIPGSLPLSSRKLIDKLNHHDLVLLEGPPGTGKTHTIMNLLIHAICSKQRILIVSDQQAAIEALNEKLIQYAIGEDQTEQQQHWKMLLSGAIKIVDDVETGEQSLPALITQLKSVFEVQDVNANLYQGTNVNFNSLEKQLNVINTKIEELTDDLALQVISQVAEETPFDIRVTKKSVTNNVESVSSFVELLLEGNREDINIISGFVENRLAMIKSDMHACYGLFNVRGRDFDIEISRLNEDREILKLIIAKCPENSEQFDKLVKEYPRNEIIRYLESLLIKQMPDSDSGMSRVGHKIRALFRTPLKSAAIKLLVMITDQIELLGRSSCWPVNIWEQFCNIHDAIRVGTSPCLALGLYQKVFAYGVTTRDSYRRKHKRALRYAFRQSISSGGRVSSNRPSVSVQGLLDQISDLYEEQGRVIRQRFSASLNDIVMRATESNRRSGTSKITTIKSLADNLKQFNSIAESGNVFNEFTQALSDTFPVWVVRKQMVPFVLPCAERSFDLVIIDEATQCRVDDAISLMYRAKKLLVVGDDKQTVLKKNSVIDDYLFKDHELDEHLRSTQARGFKGGGSHIFELVKSIKQASVMLDEHYRCPDDIIEFSNKYVYENELKIMQWRLPELPQPVVVDYSEKNVEPVKKPTSGKFKGIETKMLDRFMEYVAKTIKQIEKTNGLKINLETDVAICYFLLKNEPYVKSIKSQLLSKLDRGDDVLDGAGAALQGKERDYIFYFWDITRYNIGAFKQGDDADKRKGELNVLMSRPKKKAYHFLHSNFEQLEHGRNNITDYLWKTMSLQGKRKKRLVNSESPGSSTLLESLFRLALNKSNKRSLVEINQLLDEGRFEFRDRISVGDKRKVVDLILFPEKKYERVVGLIDLSGYGSEENVGQSIVDYYFQLKRAVPKIEPLFIYPHELIDENSQSFQLIIERIEKYLLA